MGFRRAALTLLAALATSCASTVVPAWATPQDAGDGASETGVRPDANSQLVVCGRDAVHDGDRCQTTHDSCLTNSPCGGYTACDCGADALWHCQTVMCSSDGGR